MAFKSQFYQNSIVINQKTKSNFKCHVILGGTSSIRHPGHIIILPLWYMYEFCQQTYQDTHQEKKKKEGSDQPYYLW